eukprot:2664149-Alexandrium_andersonii.AAC.1
MHWRIRSGDVKTAFLQGDSGEGERHVFAEPLADVRAYLGISHDDLLKLERSVYGLRNAPRKWYERLSHDLQMHGRRMHQLDP